MNRIMTETTNWEMKLQDDLVFFANITVQSQSFREQTHGNPYRKGTVTKTFREWLATFEFGKILLNELERREGIYKK